MKLMITVFYSCPACGLKDVAVVVPARETEDVRVWMDKTIRLTCDDHAQRSPSCHPEQLHDLKIPITGADRVGGAPSN